MSIIVPKVETDTLIEMIVQSFNIRQNIKISSSDIRFSFVHPRKDTVLGCMISTLLPDRYLKIRVYVVRFGIIPKFGHFKIEQIINTDNGINDYVYVCYVELPKDTFPGMYAASKDPSSLPNFEGGAVARPSIEEHLHSESDALEAGKLLYLSTPLYPVRGNELFVSKGSVGELKKMRAPFVYDHYTTTGNLHRFVLGIDPYSEGIYTYTQQNNATSEPYTTTGQMSMFILNEEPYSAGIYKYSTKNGLVREAYFSNGTIDDFSLFQTYFPINYTIIPDAYTVASTIASFVLT